MDQIEYYERADFHETQTGNKISVKQHIKGTDQIQVSGRCIFFRDLTLRGDLAKIAIGKYVIIHENVIIKPSYLYGITKDSLNKKIIKFNPVQIGDYVSIGNGTVIQAQKIGSCVQIGKNCTISHRCVVGENSIILDDSILPPDTMLPANSVYGGRPAILLAETPESANIIQKNKVIAFYRNFHPK